jgi:hypothetical protein
MADAKANGLVHPNIFNAVSAPKMAAPSLCRTTRNIETPLR